MEDRSGDVGVAEDVAAMIRKALQVVLNEGYGSVRIDVANHQVQGVVTETSVKVKAGQGKLFE